MLLTFVEKVSRSRTKKKSVEESVEKFVTKNKSGGDNGKPKRSLEERVSSPNRKASPNKRLRATAKLVSLESRKT